MSKKLRPCGRLLVKRKMGGYGSTTDRATGGTKKPPEGGLLGYFVISLEKVSEK